jgi:hypothetical protein
MYMLLHIRALRLVRLCGLEPLVYEALRLKPLVHEALYTGAYTGAPVYMLLMLQVYSSMRTHTYTCV